MSVAFVKNVASNTASNSTTVAVTVPAAGCAAGNVLAVRLYNWSSSVTVSSVADTQGNTYAEWVAKISGSDATFLWKSKLTTALVSGNTITATFSAMANCGISVEEFSGLDNTEDGENKATGTSTTPSVALTPTVVGVLVGNLGIQNSVLPSYTEDADTDNGDSWHSMTAVTIGTSTQIKGAYKIPTSAALNTYNPTLGSSSEWYAQLGSLKATPRSLLWNPRALSTIYSL